MTMPLSRSKTRLLSHRPPKVDFVKPFQALQNVTIENDGRALQSVKFVDLVPMMEFCKFRATDFALENVLALGNLPDSPIFVPANDFTVLDKLHSEL